jgi:hypothetical protein
METLLNTTETLVLRACLSEVINCTTNQFGYTNDVEVSGLSKSQVKGYLSQLQQKGMISIGEDNQFLFKKAGLETLKENAENFEYI